MAEVKDRLFSSGGTGSSIGMDDEILSRRTEGGVTVDLSRSSLWKWRKNKKSNHLNSNGAANRYEKSSGV